MSEVVTIHDDLPVVEQLSALAEIPKLGELALAAEITRTYNPSKVVSLGKSTDGEELFGVTVDLLQASLADYAEGDRARQRQASILISRIFMTANSISQRPDDISKSMSLRHYFVPPRPDETLLYALDADRIEALAANTKLIASMYKAGTIAQDYLAHYCQDL